MILPLPIITKINRTILALFFICPAVSLADSSPVTNSFNFSQFVISDSGHPECRIVVEGLTSGHDAANFTYLARPLQKYLTLLTGAKPLILNYDPITTTNVISYYIVINTASYPRGRLYSYQVTMLQNWLGGMPKPNLSLLIDAERLIGVNAGYVETDPKTGKSSIVQHKPAEMDDAVPAITDYGMKALEDFVLKEFGIPLSAINDPNYKWPKKPTLVIDADKFETMKYPPDQK